MDVVVDRSKASGPSSPARSLSTVAVRLCFSYQHHSGPMVLDELVVIVMVLLVVQPVIDFLCVAVSLAQVRAHRSGRRQCARRQMQEGRRRRRRCCFRFGPRSLRTSSVLCLHRRRGHGSALRRVGPLPPVNWIDWKVTPLEHTLETRQPIVVVVIVVLCVVVVDGSRKKEVCRKKSLSRQKT